MGGAAGLGERAAAAGGRDPASAELHQGTCRQAAQPHQVPQARAHEFRSGTQARGQSLQRPEILLPKGLLDLTKHRSDSSHSRTSMNAPAFSTSRPAAKATATLTVTPSAAHRQPPLSRRICTTVDRHGT